MQKNIVKFSLFQIIYIPNEHWNKIATEISFSNIPTGICIRYLIHCFHLSNETAYIFPVKQPFEVP